MKVLILVGILTSLVLTVALYVLTVHHLEHEIHQNRSHQKLRGAILEAAHQTKSYFQCADKSSSTAIENDDFCDCIDGTDEIHTSACSHLLFQQRLFKCKSNNVTIFLSRVNDGVCDCLDGSDEYGSNLECQKHIEISKLYSSF